MVTILEDPDTNTADEQQVKQTRIKDFENEDAEKALGLGGALSENNQLEGVQQVATATTAKTGKSTDTSTVRAAPPKLVYGILGLCAYLMIALIDWPKCWTSDDWLGKQEGNCPHSALPGGFWFAFIMIIVSGNIFGFLVERFTGLPGLLGMLIAGMLLKNFFPEETLAGMSKSWNSTLRNMALGIIMIRAGLGLNLMKLKEQCSSMSFLSFVPCIGEALTIAGISQGCFPDLGFVWGLMLGFVIADVSPAVTTPLLLYFNDKGYGTKKGIPTILMAAGSINSVVAIVLYSVMKEFAWGGEVDAAGFAYIIGVKLFAQIFAVGLMFGWLMGYLASYAWQGLENTEQRFVLLFASCMMLLFGWKKVGLGGGGTLAALSFGASMQFYITRNEMAPTAITEKLMSTMWKTLGSVLLFTLLGASLDFKILDETIVGFGVLIIIVGLIGRSIVTLCSVLPIKSWDMKEKLFAVITWCPKATVQAALARDALDYLEGLDVDHKIKLDPVEYLRYDSRSKIILTIAILSIIMTAPTFAVAMSKGGRKLLKREK